MQSDTSEAGAERLQRHIASTCGSYRANTLAGNASTAQPQPGHNQIPGRESGATRLEPAPIAVGATTRLGRVASSHECTCSLESVRCVLPASLQREKHTPARARHSSLLGPGEQAGPVARLTWKGARARRDHPPARACECVFRPVRSRRPSMSSSGLSAIGREVCSTASRREMSRRC